MTIGDIKETLGAKLIVGEEWMSREFIRPVVRI